MTGDYDDPVLGHVSLSREERRWCFEVGELREWPVPGAYYPEHYRLPADDPTWDMIRVCMAWVRSNESKARAFMTEKLFAGWMSGWFDEEIDEVRTPEAFGETLTLSGVHFYEDGKARLIYDDGGLFGGHGFCIEVNPSGEFVAGPEMFG